jgi:hypothetical protein
MGVLISRRGLVATLLRARFSVRPGEHRAQEVERLAVCRGERGPGAVERDPDLDGAVGGEQVDRKLVCGAERAVHIVVDLERAESMIAVIASSSRYWAAIYGPVADTGRSAVRIA